MATKPLLTTQVCFLVLTFLRTASADTENVQMASRTNNEFAMRVYQQLASESAGASLFFSPFSLESAFSAAAYGARGRTLSEMADALCFSEESLADEAAAASLLRGLATIGERIASASGDSSAKLQEEIAELRSRYAVALDASRSSTTSGRPDSVSVESSVSAEPRRPIVEPSPPKSRTTEVLESGGALEAVAHHEEWEEVLVRSAEADSLCRELNRLLARVDKYELRVANALWCEQSLPIRTSYVEEVRGWNPSQGIFTADFRNDCDGVRRNVNQWVAEQTRFRIKNLLAVGSVNELTRLIMTNAVYFKGEWSVPFEEDFTEQKDFLLDGDDSRTMDFMSAYRLGVARYAAFRADGALFPSPDRVEGDGETGLYPEGGTLVVDLPYKGGELSMLLLVPQHISGLGSLERTLSADQLQRWIDQLERRDIHLTMPKFTLETSSELSSILQAMGMQRAFLPGSEGADFSGLTESKTNDGPYIGAVVHKAFLDVNEKGTEAIAATGIMVLRAGRSLIEPFVPTVRADRPFLFLIRDRSTNTILFMGRFTGPVS